MEAIYYTIGITGGIMSSIKTAISLRKELLAQVDRVARKKGISRSRFFALAVEEYLNKHENQELLAALNEAYGEELEEQEVEQQQAMRDYQRRLVEGEW